MFNYFKKILNVNKRKPTEINQTNFSKTSSRAFSEEELKDLHISSSLSANMDTIDKIIGKNADLVIKNLELGRSKNKSAAIIYIDNMVNAELVASEIISPLVLDCYTSGLNTGNEIVKQIKAGNLISRGQTKETGNFYILLDSVLKGEVGLLIDSVDMAYMHSAKGFKYRNVAESDVEPVVTGPREAFIEVLSVNLGLIRRRICSPNLVFESVEIGKVGKNKTCMAYIKGICPEGLSDEVRSRLQRINIDDVLDSNYIEELIEDHPYSIFPQLRNTERPDVVASALLEGRVAIISDNSPRVLIAPGEFFSLMQSAEDYYNRYGFSTLVRILRYIALFMAVLLPSLYISVTNYHQEMLPPGLLISVISARSQVPFPAVIEALIMEFTFEILREAGVRMPRPIGQAVSIVGALVIGQAAVQASIVSPLMVIVVALTGIATFCIPQFNLSLPVRTLRFFLMILASFFGMFGVMIGVLLIMLHLFSMESFGKPYIAPLSPLRPTDLKDTLIRAPWWALVKRPANSSYNSKRMQSGQIPKPPRKRSD